MTIAIVLVAIALVGAVIGRSLSRRRRRRELRSTGVEPALQTVRFGPIGGVGCAGRHDPVPVIVGEGSPLIDSTEPVGYLCSKCLASCTAEGLYVGGGVIQTGGITAGRIAVNGGYSQSVGNGMSVVVRKVGPRGYDWRVVNDENGSVVCACTEPAVDQRAAIECACEVCGLDHETVSTADGTVTRTVITGSTWGTPEQFEAAVGAERAIREQKVLMDEMKALLAAQPQDTTSVHLSPEEAARLMALRGRVEELTEQIREATRVVEGSH